MLDSGVDGGGRGASSDAGGSADEGEEDGLGEELGSDVTPGGAQRATQADLGAPFEDSYEHDVADPDRSDEQGHGAKTEEQAVEGDPLLVERMVTNLVDNAAQHNIPGGRVEITTGTEQGCAVLTVANTGPVIPPGEIDRLFQPFQRLDARRIHHTNGRGLGLSIVRAIAAAHGAAITADAPSAGGLRITVTFAPIPRVRLGDLKPPAESEMH